MFMPKLFSTGSGDLWTIQLEVPPSESKHVKAISNLIQGSSSGVKAMFRTTWAGSASVTDSLALEVPVPPRRTAGNLLQVPSEERR